MLNLPEVLSQRFYIHHQNISLQQIILHIGDSTLSSKEILTLKIEECYILMLRQASVA